MLRYKNICSSDESTSLKSVTLPETLLHTGSYNFDSSFRISNSIKMIFRKILAQLIPKISKSFLTLLWCLETRPRPFHNFQYHVIWLLFSSCLLILITPVFIWKSKNQQTHIWFIFLNYYKRLVNWNKWNCNKDTAF